MKLTGTWHGEYAYGDEYRTDATVPFTMSLSELALGRVRGYVKDDSSRGGVPERGRIAGRRHDDEIEFIKTMPEHYILTEDGLVAMRGVLEAEVGGQLSEELPPLRIRYTGRIDARSMTVSGEWTILPWQAKTPRGVVDAGGGSGTWTACKASDLVSAV